MNCIKELTVFGSFYQNPDEELDKKTFDTWWNKDNFTEKDLKTYKEILKKKYSIYQNNNPSKNQSLVRVKNGTN
jgi:hypothetical protein